MADLKFRTHHGMVDILPSEVSKWQFVEQVIRKTAKKFDFEEIRTPIMEPTGLIARGVGQLTDIVSKEMFNFERGDDQFVLRPEGTAPVARAFIQHHLSQYGGSQKLFYIGPFFRAERPQKGRQRQFHQFGAELIGSQNPLADAEIIAFMLEIYNQIGIKNTILNINSIGDPETRLVYKEELKNYFKPYLNKLSELSQKRFETNPMRILDSKEKEDLPFLDNAPRIIDYLSNNSALHYSNLKKYLESMNILYQENPYLVRGLDYYSETAFELISPDLGGQDALGGGGRYDLLIEEVGGPLTPAVGFACGMERLFIAAEAAEIDLNQPSSLEVYIVTRGEKAQKWALEMLPILRANNLSCTMDFMDRSLKAQMKEANKKKTKYAIIVGENELTSNIFTLRSMDRSEEVQLGLDELLEKLTLIQNTSIETKE
ncbi:MAG: histidine--tRNA ligase [Balneolales bacterium]